MLLSTLDEGFRAQIDPAGCRVALSAYAAPAPEPPPLEWVDTLKVREMNDGGMGSLSLSSEGTEGAEGPALVTCKAAVQLTDEDGVEVVASLNASESGVPFELDIWKTNFAPLRRIPTSFSESMADLQRGRSPGLSDRRSGGAKAAQL
jgi:hypothetical protein